MNIRCIAICLLKKDLIEYSFKYNDILSLWEIIVDEDDRRGARC